MKKPAPATTPPVQLDDEFLKVVSGPIVWTWNDICWDAGNVSNLDAMELVLDADRIISGGRASEIADRKAATELLRKAYDAYGYAKVQRFLSRKIQIV